MAFTNLEKTDIMVLIYGETREHSEPAQEIYGERFLQRIRPNARTFINVVQHLRDFGRCQKKKFFTKLKTSHDQVLGVLQITWEFLSL
jgi:hypothetical protein